MSPIYTRVELEVTIANIFGMVKRSGKKFVLRSNTYTRSTPEYNKKVNDVVNTVRGDLSVTPQKSAEPAG
jgi:hypothetical protein